MKNLLAGKVCLGLALALTSIPAKTEELPVTIGKDLFGVYDLGEGDRLFLIEVNGRPAAGFPGGEVRGLFPGEQGTLMYGPSMMIKDPVQGQIVLERGTGGGGPRVTWSPTKAITRSGSRIPIRTEEVLFQNGRVRLAGTLYLPPGHGPYPAIVLTHGSGPEERGPGFYEFYFASLGLATLNYDKRGTGESTGRDWRAPFADYANDALAGVRLLKERADIQPGRIGLHGPSQGGWIAPLAASMSDDVAFVIIRSANAVTPRRQEMYMMRRRLELATDLSPGDIDQAISYLELRMDYVVTGKGRKAWETARDAKKTTPWGSYVSDGLPSAKFWRPIADYDPASALSKVRCPLLVLLGDRDTSTNTAENAPLFERILSRSGHPDYTIKVFKNANHALFETETGRSFEEELPELKRIVPGYLETMAEWLRTTVMKTGGPTG